jgi:hypothetical protein
MARDNFSSTTSLKLQKRVNSRCSNPSCRVPTNASQVGSDKAITIGIAAHICAAAEGGPRYDPLMSVAQRKDFDNGIWLCSNCATKIDRDIHQFSVAILREWKLEAESKANSELGKKLPHSDDAKDTLISALTGNQKRFIPDAILNIHKASSSCLEALDPRFKITTSYIDGTSRFVINANEDLTIKMIVTGDKAKEFNGKFTNLRESGKELEINTKDIYFEGSKLFEEILSNDANGILKISRPKRIATFKLWVKSVISNETESFEDVIGEVIVGSKEASFHGVACKSIFELSLNGLGLGVKSSANVSMTLNLKKWSGVDIRYLPYLRQLISFFEKLAAGWELHTALQVDGIEVAKSHSLSLGDMDFIYQQSSYLQYIKAAQAIASYLKVSIPFDAEVSYSIEEYIETLELARIINGTAIYSQNNIRTDITCELIVDDQLENLRLIESCKTPTVFKIEESEGGEISIFGQKIQIPPKTIIYSSILPKLIPNKSKVGPGDKVKLQMLPTESSTITKIFNLKQ